MKFINYLWFTSAVIVLMACGNNEKTTTQKSVGVALEGSYWLLTELNGKPVTSGPVAQVPYFTLNHNGLQVSGNDGCNGFGGSYELHSNGFSIQFKELIRTEMACEDQRTMVQENNFLKAIEMADSYYIKGEQLQLNKGKMAPLALFKLQRPIPADVLQ